MSALTSFMNGPVGRVARIVLGAALIYVGLRVIGGTAGYVVAAVGVLPIVLGASGRCLTELLRGA